MATQTPKQAVAALIRSWIKRAGEQKQHVAARAGFADYNEFYHAYLAQGRNLNIDPSDAIRVVRAFTEGRPAHARCTADEAVAFFILTQLPLDRYAEVWALELFPPAEWRAAIGHRLAFAPAEPAAASDDQHELLAQIARLLDARPAAVPELTLPDGPAIPPPAPLPTPSRMPLARNPLFCGRVGDLQALVAQIAAQGAAASGHAAAITGIGGMGKTSLAAEFAHCYGQFFAGGVFWLNCADAQALPAEVAACGASGLISRDDWADLALETQVQLVRQAWEQPIPRLLVFDNCEDETLLAQWRPASGGCRLLLTSRRERWPQQSGVAGLALAMLPRAESVALLRQYRPDLPASLPALDALASELGDLPLALHLAGSYLETYRHDPPGRPEQFLAELRAAGLIEHDAMQGVDVADTATTHTRSVGKTFALSFERLDPADPADALARAMLARAGYFAPNAPFERALLPAALPGNAGERLALRALRRLIELGLLNESGDRLLIHPIVAAYARRTAPPEPARAAVEQLLAAQAAARYADDDTAGLRALLPHLHLRADAAAARDDELAIQMHNWLPFLLDAAGDATGGLPYLERALEMLQHAETLDTLLAAEVLNNLGEWVRAAGAASRAEGYHQQALAIRRQLLPPDAPDLAESYNNLAELQRQQGNLAAARANYGQALAIWQARFGDEYPYTLLARNNIALLLLREQPAAAAEQFAQVLATAQAIMPAGDSRIGRTHNNLGEALRQLGELERAEEHFGQAHAILHAKLGDTHPETMLVRMHQAQITAAQGDCASAREAIAAVLAHYERTLGPGSPLAGQARQALAELPCEQA